MKTQLIIYPAMIVTLFIACDDKNDNRHMEGNEDHSEMNGSMQESDTNMVKRDGTLLSGTIDQMDSVHLPAPVIKKIKEDAMLSKEKINEIRKFIEDDLTYYEIKFTTANTETKTVIFDENGKVRTKE
ncbi:hypothetical protein U3A58_18345 [Algoriphagus sp. C2-6-M1]|uniref:hypothetical protein n=1 Tax=Algoriphagus persicinus TaxID=3108754 RepID=UPI002B396E89|nr:hypothetical protein [Algoriphagus sp. C2-6-M1]MEB2782356.1 hypothetical protein [Algoriphagus sp. C2-6-M1]